MQPRALDDSDRRILRAMQSHPDMSVADLSGIVGLSQTPCWRRIKRLEAEGVIARRAILFDPKKVGLPINVLAHVRLQRHDEETLEALERETLEHPEILECFSMSGESDYVMRVVAADMDAYERFLKKVLLHLPGIASVNSSFTLKTVKSTPDLPL
ncbi:MAG: Lrp/AsnC family transcriptional regulator [Pseudomonadota bacterium]|uniref:Lrp/AsnC family transcriptional regulator n=1 Tax=Rhizorhabdus phycosphaerae TaxID=2711156 RepID=UPI0013EA4DC7|nr:Lrp/AsnC family transcriptional regulator [Rhizorhabdus phycosphaerae]